MMVKVEGLEEARVSMLLLATNLEYKETKHLNA
jgi:hypothetical protein